jgi:hypothetical protein
MHLYYLADGPREETTIPAIVRSVCPGAITSLFKSWSDITLAKNSGYQRKLDFAIRTVLAEGWDGVVATVDCDRDKRGKKLGVLNGAREVHRRDTRVPQVRIAFGEAIPHFEAWLIDDPKAVRTALALHSSTEIPNVRDCVYPKATIDELVRMSPRQHEIPDSTLRGEIAQAIDEKRCNHRDETGFEAFMDELRANLC